MFSLQSALLLLLFGAFSVRIGDLVRDSFSGKHGVVLGFLDQKIRTPFRAKGRYVEVLFEGEVLIGPVDNLEVVDENR